MAAGTGSTNSIHISYGRFGDLMLNDRDGSDPVFQISITGIPRMVVARPIHELELQRKYPHAPLLGPDYAIQALMPYLNRYSNIPGFYTTGDCSTASNFVTAIMNDPRVLSVNGDPSKQVRVINDGNVDLRIEERIAESARWATDMVQQTIYYISHQ